MNARCIRLITTAVVSAALAGPAAHLASAGRSHPVYAIEAAQVIERHPEGPGFILVVTVKEGVKIIPVTEEQYDLYPPLSRICIRFERGKLRGALAQPVPLVAVK